MNIRSSLIAEMKEKSYRDAWVASQIRISLPLQIRALRKSRHMSQPELAQLAGMAQPRISEIEKPGERRLNIETLLRLASAFDVGLEVRFVPFDRLIDDTESVDLDNIEMKTFDELVEDAEKDQKEQQSPFVDNLESFADLGAGIGGLSLELASEEEKETSDNAMVNEPSPKRPQPDVGNQPNIERAA